MLIAYTVALVTITLVQLYETRLLEAMNMERLADSEPGADERKKEKLLEPHAKDASVVEQEVDPGSQPGSMPPADEGNGSPHKGQAKAPAVSALSLLQAEEDIMRPGVRTAALVG